MGQALIPRIRLERGQALAEYTLVLALVFAICVAAVGIVGLAIAGFFDSFVGAF